MPVVRHPSTLFAGLLGLPLALALHAPQLCAQGGSSDIGRFLDKTHVLSIGAAQQTMDASIRATVDDRDPVGLTLEDLGIDDKDSSYFASYQYRWKPRWSLLAGAYSFNGTGGRTAQRDFNFDGVDYTAGAALAAKLDADAYLFDVLYTVRQGENYEISVGGGIHALELGATIATVTSINGENRRSGGSGTTLLAPVPNLVASATWEPSERIVLSAVGGWLSANAGDFEGSFVYANLRAMYRFTDSVGLALSYQRTEVDITETRARSENNYDLRFDGPTLTFVYAF